MAEPQARTGLREGQRLRRWPPLLPAPALIALAIAWLTLAVAAALAWVADATWLAAGWLLLALALIDGWLAWRRPLPAVRRQYNPVLALGSDSRVRLHLDNHAAVALALHCFDHAPAVCESFGNPQFLTLPGGASATIEYRLRPLRRGAWHFGACELRLRSPLGLWWRTAMVGEPGSVRVYPNFAALRRYALLATDHRLSQAGILKRRRRGEGMDFHQLREYREGDSPRQLDWKASARMRRLISREYRDERDQQVLLLLDCGRRMAARDGPLSHLDHALNAALLLAHVALRQGDAVGMMTMAGVQRWVPPRKSQAGLNALLAEVYDIDSSPVAPDYYSAAVELLRRQRKRCLVVWITNLRDEDDDGLRLALSLLRQRHLVVLASLRETILDAVMQSPVGSLDDALTHCATAQYLQQRQRQFALLEQSRIPCLDVEPQALPVALVNRYGELKRAGAI